MDRNNIHMLPPRLLPRHHRLFKQFSETSQKIRNQACAILKFLILFQNQYLRRDSTIPISISIFTTLKLQSQSQFQYLGRNFLDFNFNLNFWKNVSAISISISIPITMENMFQYFLNTEFSAIFVVQSQYYCDIYYIGFDKVLR